MKKTAFPGAKPHSTMLFWCAILFAGLNRPGVAWAEGLHHATEFVMRRDGAWIANFAILLSGILFLIFRFMLPALRKRTEDLAEAMDVAAKAKREAEARMDELDAKMRAFEQEAQRVQAEAREQGEALKAKIIAEAVAAAKRILDKAQSEIESETMKAATRLKKETVAMAMEMASGALAKNFNETDQRNAVKEYLQRVGEAK
jgi:F-type H+-transporting ATPase subunit b